MQELTGVVDNPQAVGVAVGGDTQGRAALQDLLGLVGLRGLALQLVVCVEIEVCLVEL